MKKLYITDLDGTLLNQNASISPYSEQVIKKIIKQGIHFTIATGRSPIRIFSILQNIPLKLPCYFKNGAAIYDIENQECLQQFQSVKPVFKVYLTLSKNELTRWIYPNTKQSIKWDYYRFPYTAIANIPEDIRFNFDTFQSRAKR